MSIATELLSLRRDRSSSVETLLGLLEWQHSAQDPQFAETRRYACEQAADIVLMNVAVHALEAEVTFEPRPTRRTIRWFWRKRRRSDEPRLSQRQQVLASLQ